jgi:Flp pilus assembly protein TadB
MKKILVTAVLATALFAAQNANGQSLSADQQAIINRQRIEIQQKRNSANEYQQKADEAGRQCQKWKDMKDPGEDVKSITVMISKYCGDQEIYQKKANQLRAEANELERLLNIAIEKAKANNR